ncbi:MAG: hypothetical protein ACJAU0_000051 [Flavobacteriales bacterium]|jgi:hypothetical protein
MIFRPVVIVFAVFLFACNAQEEEVHEKSEIAQESERHMIELTNFGYPIQCVLPADLASKGEAVIDFNRSTGELTISVGSEYIFHVTEDPTPLGKLRDELRYDDLFNYTFYEEGNDGFLYESILPTGESYSFHVMRSFEVDGRKFIAVTDDNSVYTKYEARLVSETINSLSKVQ